MLRPWSFRTSRNLARAGQSRAVGWALLAIGALSTVPIAATLIRRTRVPLLAD